MAGQDEEVGEAGFLPCDLGGRACAQKCDGGRGSPWLLVSDGDGFHPVGKGDAQLAGLELDPFQTPCLFAYLTTWLGGSFLAGDVSDPSASPNRSGCSGVAAGAFVVLP